MDPQNFQFFYYIWYEYETLYEHAQDQKYEDWYTKIKFQGRFRVLPLNLYSTYIKGRSGAKNAHRNKCLHLDNYLYLESDPLKLCVISSILSPSPKIKKYPRMGFLIVLTEMFPEYPVEYLRVIKNRHLFIWKIVWAFIWDHSHFARSISFWNIG